MIQRLKSRSGNNFLSFLGNPVCLAFTASFIYWIYLFFTSSMLVVFDSIGYQKLGTLIGDEGWVRFFQTGPHREPVYPFIISISISISKVLGVTYQPILKTLQLLLLFLTQILTLKILQNLKVRHIPASLCILYLGFSPALVNSALSIYSEIATFPFLLGITLSGVRLWRAFTTDKWPSVIPKSLLLIILFIGMTLIKSIYEYIFYIFMIPFFIICIRSFILKKKNEGINISIFLILAIPVFSFSLHAYKHLNEKYTGNYTLTDSRGPFSIYSSAARRTEDLTFKQILAGIAYTAGKGACEQFFGEEDCYFWGIHNYDFYGMTILTKIKEEYPKDKVPEVMIDLSKEKILEKPLQFAFLTVLESVKMFFWESTQIGFVIYAPWQTKLYAFGPFKNILRLVISLLSLGAFLFVVVNVLKNRKLLLDIASPEGKVVQTIGFILLIATCHIGLYSLFMTIPRFILPIAPLYLIFITFSFDRIIPHSE